MPVNYIESTDVYSTQAPSPQRFELEVLYQRRLPVIVGDAVSLGELYVDNPTGIVEVNLGFDGDGGGNEFSRTFLMHILPGATLNLWQSVPQQGPLQTPSGDDVELLVRVDAKMAEFAVRRTSGTIPARAYGLVKYTGLWLAQYKHSAVAYLAIGVVPVFAGTSVWSNATTPPTSSFSFTQAVPSDFWTVNHALGYRPIPVVFSVAGDVVTPDIENPSANQTIIRFASPQIGTARFV